ncbi:hypothetical protein PNEG_01571 [Pneumocystis murina B123]|uniref:Thioredoxin peroxidase n=1 Tax=Pneumocystis murina (strain B123) TaxID=1069680 RepID=M7PIP6_PNEMU|nr:hypothetical protein PNEG_01571 [Pneumocystis murina B123]EMR10314.1 hypothetical protein PNEG_01571 [Pneumocystis murina B123]
MALSILKKGSKLPFGTFTYIPYDGNKCSFNGEGVPVEVTTDDWKNLKVVLFSVPGAFTPTCSSRHLPDVINHYEELKAKNVDLVAFVAANDPFVMAAWGDAFQARDKIHFLTDTDANFSHSIGYSIDLKTQGFGIRTGRYAIVVDRGVVIYAEVEKDPNIVTTSGVKAVLANL